MKILVLADHEAKALYDYYDPERVKDVDLVISCGDLEPGYLSFLATVIHVPVLYVHGNHDGIYERKPPGGCICIEDDIYVYKGIRILGLGGSMEYIPETPNQYTERRMKARIRKLYWKLRRQKGFDILVTHAPAYHFHDLEDRPHWGFACFRTLMEKYNPKLFVHGHVHANYGSEFKRSDYYGNTLVVNAYEYAMVEYPEVQNEACASVQVVL